MNAWGGELVSLGCDATRDPGNRDLNPSGIITVHVVGRQVVSTEHSISGSSFGCERTGGKRYFLEEHQSMNYLQDLPEFDMTVTGSGKEPGTACIRHLRIRGKKGFDSIFMCIKPDQ